MDLTQTSVMYGMLFLSGGFGWASYFFPYQGACCGTLFVGWAFSTGTLVGLVLSKLLKP